mgnify:CR=1 FL=1
MLTGLAPLLSKGLPAYRLPSTSPANAGWNFQRKLAAWRELFQPQGRIPTDA